MKYIKVKLSSINLPEKFRVSNGYTAKRGKDVVAFYVDGHTKTGGIHGTCSSTSTTVFDKESGEIKVSRLPYPCIAIVDGSDDCEDIIEMYFPEYEGWVVHSYGGGKTMAVCLTRRRK